MADQSGVDFGLLQAQQAAPQAKTVTTQGQQAGGPGQAGLQGMLTNKLNALFGTNSVQTANNAITGSMANTPAGAIANGLLGSLGGQKPQAQPNQPAPQQQALNDGYGVDFGASPAPQQAAPGQPQVPPGIVSPEPQLMMNDPKTNISNIYKVAQDVYQDNPTMAKLAASQAIHESNLNGTPSTLSSKHNNLFGIKGIGNAGSVTMNTTEHVNGHDITVPQQFAAYKTPRDSMIAQKALMSNKRYKNVMNADSLEAGAQALQDGGYATDPNYAKGLTAASKLLPQDNTQLASNSSESQDDGV